MAPRHDELCDKHRQGRKLHKKSRPNDHIPSIELPPNLKETDDAADEDITAPRGPSMFSNMNQSLFGLVVAAGSNFERGPISDSSDEDDEASQPIAQTAILPRRPVSASATRSQSHRRKHSTKNMLKSFTSLSSRSKSRQFSEPELFSESPGDNIQQTTSSDELPTLTKVDESTQQSEGLNISQKTEHSISRSSVAPIMSRIIEARDEMASRPSFDIERRSQDGLQKEDETEDADFKPTRLAQKLKDTFNFGKHEEVIAGMLQPSLAPAFKVSKRPYDLKLIMPFNRISCLVPQKCHAPGLYVHHSETCMLLFVFAKKNCKSQTTDPHMLEET